MTLYKSQKKILIGSRCTKTAWILRRQLASYLIEKGWKVAIAAHSNPEYDKRLQELGVIFFPVGFQNSSKNPIAQLQMLISLVRTLKRFAPDVVHFFTIKPVIFGSIVSFLMRIRRIVSTITGLGHAFVSNRPAVRTLATSLYRLSLRLNDCVIFQNPDDRDFFVDRGLVSPDKTKLVFGSGVDTAYFTPQDVENDHFTFLMVSRLIREKGIVEFLKAASELTPFYPRVRFQVLGDFDPSNPSSLKSSDLETYKKISQIQFLGHQEDVRKFLDSASAVVLPSYREGLPRSLIEAAACGKALITTSTAGCKEVVKDGENGFLVPAKDVEALKTAMGRMIENKADLDSMGAKSRLLALEKFDMKIIFDAYLEIYKTGN